MFTIRSKRLPRLSSVWTMVNGPYRFTLIVFSKSSMSTCWSGTGFVYPALLTRMSIPPPCSSASEARANITTVVISSLLRMNRRVVSRPMPRDAPVTSAVLLIVVLLRAQEEPGHLQIGLGGHLEVLVVALDEVDRVPEVRHQRG